MARFGWKSFIGGVVVGALGLELLRQKEADKVLVGVTEGVLVAKDWVMERVEKIQARASDVYDDAKGKTEDYLQRKAAGAEAEPARGEDE